MKTEFTKYFTCCKVIKLGTLLKDATLYQIEEQRSK